MKKSNITTSFQIKATRVYQGKENEQRALPGGESYRRRNQNTKKEKKNVFHFSRIFVTPKRGS